MAGNGADETESEPVSQLSERDYLLRRFEAVIGFWKVVVGTALVGLASVLIPGAIQFWELQFKERRQEVELNIAQDEAQRDTITQFIDFALNEDIELRIRMAEYFGVVTDEPEQSKWKSYYRDLVERRNTLKKDILDRETRRNQIELTPDDARSEEDRVRLVTLRLELAWLYGELGRAIRGESVVPTLNERQTPETAECPAASGLMARDVNPEHLHPVLREKTANMLATLNAEGIPFELFEGFRSPFRQNQLFAQGRTRPGNKVTYVGPWRSGHEYGVAADLVLRVDGSWNWDTSGQRKAWWDRMHAVALEQGLELMRSSAGRIVETPHVQLPGIRTAALLEGNLPEGGDDTWRLNLERHASAWRSCGMSPAAPILSIAEEPPANP